MPHDHSPRRATIALNKTFPLTAIAVPHSCLVLIARTGLQAEDEDLVSFVQRNVQAAVDAATARDASASASGDASLAGSVRSLQLSTAQDAVSRDAAGRPAFLAGVDRDGDADCAGSQAPESSVVDPLNITGQPQVAVRLHKARIKVCPLSGFLARPERQHMA